MSILDNEGHDPRGLGNTPRHSALDELIAENERLRAALKPLADIPLWRDRYPDAKEDQVSEAALCRLTVDHVRAARAAMPNEQDAGYNNHINRSVNEQFRNSVEPPGSKPDPDMPPEGWRK